VEPDIKYAKNGDVHIAYRVLGDGPRDIVLVPGTISHVELLWEVPTNRYLLQRLTSFARVIVFDKRGQGLSDRVAEQTLEERTADVGAVMNAAGSKRAIVYGWSEGGLLSVKFAATHPERTAALVLYGAFASETAEPWVVPEGLFEKFLAALEKGWGTGVLLRLNAPSRLKDEALIQWFGRIERESASPASILALMRATYKVDIRHLLPSIRVPTLILHRAGDAMTPVAAGRYLAEKIPGAKYHELPGMDHLVLDHETQDPSPI
jgi:pimeloyl-ACP methyl ester carboxylesterase